MKYFNFQVFGKVSKISGNRIYVLYNDDQNRIKARFGSFYNDRKIPISLYDNVYFNAFRLSLCEFSGDEIWISAIITSLALENRNSFPES